MTWAPFSTFDWSLSPLHAATSFQPGCLFPSPSQLSLPDPGGGIPWANVTIDKWQFSWLASQ